MERKMDVFVVWGSDPQRARKEPLEVHMDQESADGWLFRALINTIAAEMSRCRPGGRVSVLVTRGRIPAEGEANPPGTSGSFVVDNPEVDGHKASREEWEFLVERRAAEPVPLSEAPRE